MWFSGRLSFHHHYHYLNSYTGFQFLIELILSSTLTYRVLSTQQPPYYASLLHLSNISRQLRSSISQLIIPKTKLNLGKPAFSVAAPRVWNELPITLKTSETIAIFQKNNSKHIYSKLHFHHKRSVVPRSDTDICASLITIMLNDSVLLRL